MHSTNTDTSQPFAPSFVTITDVSLPNAKDREYVISNEATGRHFLANEVTVHFFETLRLTGSIPRALQQSSIDAERGKALVQQLLEHGVLVRRGETLAKPAVSQAPIEGKLISMRWDLIDSSAVTERFASLGRFLFSPFGYIVWAGLMAVMLFQLLVNREKAALTLVQIFDASFGQWLIFIGLFVALKVVHEMGHALAYQEMCRQEGLSPGPIRMGLCIFAMSPFPFTDVTGAWRLRSRFRRIMIGGGGIYVETWIMAALTVFWAQTQAGMLQTVILQVAVIAGAMALLFNLNPAVKLDGYFMLTDYLRRPNLSGRASVAARSVFARFLGAPAGAPNRGDLLYWGISYAYRWTIFAGIFWLAYQFDWRLGPVVLIAVAMMLVVRPLMASVKFAHRIGVRPVKSSLTLAVVVGLVILAFVPLPYWQTVPASMMRYETRFVEPTEAGVVRLTEGRMVEIETPDLAQQIRDVEIRRDMLGNLKRARFASAEEQTRLTGEIARFEETRQTLLHRQEGLTASLAENAVWTPLEARWLDAAWVAPGQGRRLAAISDPLSAFVRLRLEQRLLNSAVDLRDGAAIRMRPIHNTGCTFGAELEVEPSSMLALDGTITLRATPTDADMSCVRSIPHGAALVARLSAQDRSFADRLRLGVMRLLQDRLPVHNNEQRVQ